MVTLYAAFDRALAIVCRRNSEWEVTWHLAEGQPQCLAIDPLHPHYVYCGTLDQGLWQSVDAGANWEQTGAGISSRRVLAVAVSSLEQMNGASIVYAGTEPSALFRSEDRGQSWRALPALLCLPSALTWSFPPRPWTSHIRWIVPDPLIADRLFVAVEAGALLRSLDSGQTWDDRKPDGPLDTHTLVMSPLAPDRLYSAAGDGFLKTGTGFAQSDDGGETWSRPNEGIAHHYLWSIAVDPADPETLLISAAPGPQEAHSPHAAESFIYRRTHGSPWQPICSGLPPAHGSRAAVLTTNPAEANVFYAANNHGIFRSANAGLDWEMLSIPWSDNAPQLGRAHALIAVSS